MNEETFNFNATSSDLGFHYLKIDLDNWVVYMVIE